MEKSKKNLTKMQSFEIDFYSIEDNNGCKDIHIFGTLWRDGGICHATDYTFLIIPLDEFVSRFNEDKNYVITRMEEVTQYEDKLTYKECFDLLAHYFNGNPADAILDYADITLDTPIGNYRTN